MAALLEVNGIYKSFPNFKIKDISFSLEPGYIMGLIGQNGSGKSTIIKMIMNMYKKSNGSICINGRDNDINEIYVKNEIGYVADENIFSEELSINENVKVLGKYFDKFDYELFYKYIENFGINSKVSLRKLSRGSKIKIQLAFALSHEATLFIFDEPGGSLDESFREELISIMADIVSNGKRSILYSTHLTESLDKIADYITFIDNGEVIFSTEKDELLDRYKVVKGEGYLINNINPENVVYKEEKEHYMRALIKNRGLSNTSNLTVENPNVEDIMYYFIKGMKKCL